MKTEKKYLIYGISLILLTLIGVSLAYFVTEIVGDKKSVSISTGDLRVVFTDTDGSITGDYIEPGWSDSKSFSVENKTNSEYEYDIVIKDLVNTFKTSGYLVYKITSTSGYNMTDYKDVPKSSTATDTVLAYSVSIPSKSTHTYTIEIKYINDENASQNIDMNSTLSGNIYISKGTKEIPQFIMKILADNQTINERTDFSVTNTSDTTGSLFSTTLTEDGSTQYYYSGNTTNNWVLFGGFYWRIIRTNEDDSVRLLYAGTSPNTIEGYINSSTAFNSTGSESRYVGYMYGGNTSLADNRANTTDSTIKGVIDTWYQNNLLESYDKYISKTAIYCNDRSIHNLEGSGTWVNTGSTFYYGADGRLWEGTYAPNYKCGTDTNNGLFESKQTTQDKFSASTTGGGNGELTYGISLMTADEIAFAGGVAGTTLSSPYAYYYTNSEGSSITDSYYWWLLSPFYFGSSDSYVFSVNGSNKPGELDGYHVAYTYAVRPVVSLSSCTHVTGTGTVADPYQIDESSSTC